MDNQLTIKYIRTKGKLRKLVTYTENNELKRYHLAVTKYLKQNTINSIFAKAYTPKSSIYKNAMAHMYNDIFLKMDIKDFFPSINHKYLSNCLFYEINKNTEISYKECCDIVRKCSVSKKGLPLGLISSPALANLYMKEFDGIFYGYIKNLELSNPIYTRYADDIIVSFKYQSEYQEKIDLIKIKANNLAKKYYLLINDKKTKVVNLNISNHVRITGISVTKDKDNYRRITVGKKMKNELFWKALNLYDNPTKRSYLDVLRIKGLLSFILSIEKESFESGFSIGMIQLLNARGFDNLRELINKL